MAIEVNPYEITSSASQPEASRGLNIHLTIVWFGGLVLCQALILG